MQRPLFSDSAGSGRSSFGHANLGTRKKTRFLQILLICSFIAAGGIGIFYKNATDTIRQLKKLGF